MYTVTRQLQWPDGNPVVEVSEGGIDYVNPDVLTASYPGEFDEFKDPRDAIKTAISICKEWRKDGMKNAKIGIGATGGMTIPFDTCTFKEAKEWADKTYDKLKKCPASGAIVEDLDEWWGAGEY